MRRRLNYLRLLPIIPLLISTAHASEASLYEQINSAVAPWTAKIFEIIFFKPFSLGGKEIPFILIWLAGSAIFLTVYFKFINITSFGLAIRTIRGKYSKPTDPGEITHFQALTAALSPPLDSVTLRVSPLRFQRAVRGLHFG